MAQPAHIELKTGPDRAYRFILHIAWALAATAIIVNVPVLGWPSLAAAGCLLIALWPGLNDPIMASGRLFLYRNGSALLQHRVFSWGGQTWACRWFSVIRLDQGNRPQRVLVFASRNLPDEYRRLLVWTRFNPNGETQGSGARALP